MMKQYEALEERMAYKDVQRVESALMTRLHQLSAFTRDWAVWDDTYAFLEGENDEYIESNWIQETFDNVAVDFVYYIQEDGSLVFFDYDREAEGASALIDIDVTKYFNNFLSVDRAHNGIVNIGSHVVLAASSPIYDTNRTVNPNGVLIGGMMLNHELLNSISDDTGLAVSWSVEADVDHAPQRAVTRNDSTIQGLYVFPYTNTNTFGQLSFVEKRDIYLQAQASQNWAIVIYGSLTIVFVLLTLLLLDRFILSRMKKLNAHLEEIEDSRDVTKRIPIKGNDEITNVEEGINRMLIALADSQQEVKHMAETDSLTGFFNRKAFTDKVNDCLNKLLDRSYYLLFIDIDLFKRINDTLGHHAGDEVLLQLTERISNCLSDNDFAGRWGGDEFVLFINCEKQVEMNMMIENLLSSIEQPLTIEKKRKLQVTSSIGISRFPEDGDSAETLIQRADLAMYNAKQKGKNQHKYYHKIDNEP